MKRLFLLVLLLIGTKSNGQAIKLLSDTIYVCEFSKSDSFEVAFNENKMVLLEKVNGVFDYTFNFKDNKIVMVEGAQDTTMIINGLITKSEYSMSEDFFDAVVIKNKLQQNRKVNCIYFAEGGTKYFFWIYDKSETTYGCIVMIDPKTLWVDAVDKDGKIMIKLKF